MNILDKNLKIKNQWYPVKEQICTKCGKNLTHFIAYIPSIGEACIDCYNEAAKKDELTQN
jgi:hypothetical protein